MQEQGDNIVTLINNTDHGNFKVFICLKHIESLYVLREDNTALKPIRTHFAARFHYRIKIRFIIFFN